MNDDDWELVAGDDEVHPEIKPPIHGTPSSRFYFELKVGKFGFTRGTPPHFQDGLIDRLPSREISRSKEEDSLLILEQQQSPLFALPPEIRFQIYDFLLQPCCDDHGVLMTNSPVNPRLPTVLSILSTCRRAHHEAEHIFYMHNRLYFKDKDFLLSLEPGRRNAILALTVPAHSASLLLEILKRVHDLPNLRSLHLVRQVPIKYINVQHWRILAPQLVAEVEKLPQLEDFKIITPDAHSSMPGDAERKEMLYRIDDRLRRAVALQNSSVLTQTSEPD